MGTKISALTEVITPNATDMMVIVNSAATKKVQAANVVKAATATWARVYHNAGQTIATATVTPLAFNSERGDTEAIHDTATNNSRLTCQTAGVYHIVASVDFQANATGYRTVAIRLNGTTNLAAERLPGLAGVTVAITIPTIYPLSVADYVEAVVYQDSGGNLDVNLSPNYSPEFMMARIGA